MHVLRAGDMHTRALTRAQVLRHIEDSDRVFLAEGRPYTPETADHQSTWPKIQAAIGTRGAWYSTLRALSRSNAHYIAYLIGDLQVLRCPALETRLGVDPASRDSSS